MDEYINLLHEIMNIIDETDRLGKKECLIPLKPVLPFQNGGLGISYIVCSLRAQGYIVDYINAGYLFDGIMKIKWN